MMATRSDLDKSMKENSEEETNLYLMTNHSEVINYYSNSEYEDIDVQEILLEELNAAISRIKELKKQVRIFEESEGKQQKENASL